jgi:hypothetical protein
MTPQRVPVIAAVFGTVVLALVSVLLMARRMSGAFTMPLDWPGLLLAGFVLAGVCVCIRTVGLWSQGTTMQNACLCWLPLASVVLIASAILIPGSSVLGTSLFVGILAVEETYTYLALGTRLIRPLGAGLEVADGSTDETVDQQFIRRRTAEGEEVLEGALRVQFVPGQRAATAHVSFCPPFERTPHIGFEQSDGPEARIRLEQVLPFGARFEIKRPMATTNASLALTFVARSEPAAAAGPIASEASAPASSLRAAP